MVITREKGKIARNEWSRILARYNDGETIAQIGRDYGCTAPAIRYIIKRTGTLKDHAAGMPAARAATRPLRRAARPDRIPEPASMEAPVMAPSAILPRVERGLSAELRKRVTGDVAAFLVALDQAMLDPSSEGVAGLQEATDRLMRSTARVRLDLERLLEEGETAGAGARRAREAAARP